MKKRKPLWMDLNLQIVFLITLMAVLGVSSIAPAFPRVREELDVTSAQIGLLISVFTVPGVLFTPFLGVLADRIGRKKVVVPSLFLFGIAGGACAMSTNFEMLLALRFFQGLGAAALGSLNVTIIGDIYSGSDTPKAVGYNAGVLSVGTGIYPLLGGILATFGWFYPFLMPLVAVPIGFVTLFLLKSPEPRSEQGMVQYLKRGWSEIRNVRHIMLYVTSTATFIVLYGCFMTFIPLLLRDRFELPDYSIGLLMALPAVFTAIASALLGTITKWIDETKLIKLAFILYGVSLMMMPLMPDPWLICIPIAVFGTAMGLNVPAIQSLLARYSSREHLGGIMSVYGTLLRLGQTLGPIFAGLVFVLWGTNTVFWVGVIAIEIMLIFLVVLLKR